VSEKKIFVERKIAQKHDFKLKIKLEFELQN